MKKKKPISFYMFSVYLTPRGMCFRFYRNDAGQTFVINDVVVETSRSVFHSQTIPQREVIHGEQVVFVRCSQELSVWQKLDLLLNLWEPMATWASKSDQDFFASCCQQVVVSEIVL